MAAKFFYATLITFILFIGFVITNHNTLGFLSFLLCIFSFVLCIIFVIVDLVSPTTPKTAKTKESIDTSNIVFKSYFLSTDKIRKKDGELKRGDCKIEFIDDRFIIRQDNEKIENLIESIYYFGIWEYKDNNYFKFRMRNLNELKFCSQYFEADKIADLLRKRGIKIEDDRN